MSLHPLVSEKMVKSRMADRERSAAVHRRAPVYGDPPLLDPLSLPALRPRHHSPSRLVGGLLIVAGRRLAGPEALAAALDRSGVGRGRTAA
jgi:hypothetical protein